MRANTVLELLRSHVIIPDRRPIWAWAAENVDFGNSTSFKGRYDVDNVPWTREFLRAAKDARVREVTLVAPPQDSGKTVAAEIALAHRISTSPTNAAFNTETNVKAEKWGETRWDRMFLATPKLREQLSENRNKKKKNRIIFRNGTFLLIQGAEVPANRASDSVEMQVNDELHLWQNPWLTEMRDRTNAYRDTRKILNVSVGGKKGSELHAAFQAGNQGEWHHRCESCGNPLSYVFNNKDPLCNIRFDLNAAVLHADGRLELREFEKTVFVECQNPACRAKMRYDKERLRAANRVGLYVSRNPGADPELVSLHVNAFAIGREPWHKILEPWVKLHVRGGVFAPEILKHFITQKLAEFWDEKPYVVTTEIKLAGWARGEVLRRGSWPDEAFRVMACDNQRGKRGDIPHRWFVCIAFSKSGRARLVDAGRLNEWAQVKAKQRELGIPEPTETEPGPWVMVDRRWDPVDVDDICATNKWFGMMGAAQEEFLHPPYSPFAGTRQLFTEPRAIDIGFGTAEMGRRHAIYFLWCAQKIQDLVAQLRNSGMLEVPRDVGDFCPEFAEHMNSHRQIMETNRTGGEVRVWKRIGDAPDHLYDCVCQATVAGCMAGIYRKDET